MWVCGHLPIHHWIYPKLIYASPHLAGWTFDVPWIIRGVAGVWAGEWASGATTMSALLKTGSELWEERVLTPRGKDMNPELGLRGHRSPVENLPESIIFATPKTQHV